MINGLEGIPGSGKTYEAVAFHILPALQSGRKVITNLPLNVDAFSAIDPSWRDLIEIRQQPALIRGDWDASDIAKKPAFQLWPDGRTVVPAVSVATFGGVWDYYTDWKDNQGRGPLFVVDECHVALAKGSTPDSVVQWFKLHRHFNVDVLLITQSFRDINQPIAQLLATLIKCRKADVLGRADHYIRKVMAGYRGAQIQVDQRPYKKQYFALYKSHTQGSSVEESKAQDISPMIVKFNRVKWVVIAVGVVASVWAFWPKSDRTVFGVKDKVVRKNVTLASSPASLPPAVAPASASVPGASAPSPVASEPDVSVSEPLAGKALHITGEIDSGLKRVVSFVVSLNSQRLFTITDKELTQAGYRYEHLSYCAGWLEYAGKRRPVTCDAPQLTAGRADMPVVVSNGVRSDRVVRRSEIVDFPIHRQSNITVADVVASYRLQGEN